MYRLGQRLALRTNQIVNFLLKIVWTCVCVGALSIEMLFELLFRLPRRAYFVPDMKEKVYGAPRPVAYIRFPALARLFNVIKEGISLSNRNSLFNPRSFKPTTKC